MIEDTEKIERVRELRLDELKSVGGGFTASGVGNTGFGAMWLTKALKYMAAPST